MITHNQDEFLRGEAEAEVPSAQQDLQHRKHQEQQQQQECHVRRPQVEQQLPDRHVPHPQEQRRQQEQEYPQQQIRLFVKLRLGGSQAGERSVCSSVKGRTTTSAAAPSTATISKGTASELLAAPSSSSASSSAATASSQSASLCAVASSDDPPPCSVDYSVEATASKAAQEPSVDSCEVPGGNSSNRNRRGGQHCGCTVAIRKVCCGGLQYLEHQKARSLDAIMYGFERYAAVVYKHSWLVLIASVLLTAALSVGVFRRTKERDVYKLYSLKVSSSQKSKEKVFSAFPPDRVLQVIVESESGDLLQQESLQQLANLQASLQSLTLERDAVKTDEYNRILDKKFDRAEYPATLTYQDLCAVDAQNQCVATSVLDLYPEPAAYGRMPLLLQSKNNPVILNSRTGRVFRVDSILAKYELRPVAPGQPEQQVMNAHVALLRMNFRGDEKWRPFVAAFEELVTQYLLDHRRFNTDLFLTPRTDRSAADELHRASTLDLPHWMMLVGAGVLVTIYTSVVNSSLTYRTKLLPSAMGALASFLGYLGGAGAVYLCGVNHTAPADATPFLALGIGVDDLFVIINAYSLTYLYKDPQRRVVSAVRDAGLSISLTTVTNVITFMIGAVCPYYSISGFCLVTAGALCWGYVMCLTFFLAVLCIDARREARKQMLLHALLCMRTAQQGHPTTLSAITPMAAPDAAPIGAATPLHKAAEKTALTNSDRPAAAGHAQQRNMARGEDIEDVTGAGAATAGAEWLAEPRKTAGNAGPEDTARDAAAPLTSEVPQIVDRETSLDLESSPVACYGEELLTTHELAALMVLYQKRKRQRAAEGTPSTRSAGEFVEKNREAGGYVCDIARDVQQSSTACEVTPHSSNGGSRGRESPQESYHSSAHPKEEDTVDNGRESSPEKKNYSDTVSQGGSGLDGGCGDTTRNNVDPITIKQCASWETRQGSVEGVIRTTNRPTAEETAHLLQHFQQELEENPDRLLSLYHPEPRGNPGRIWRLFFREYYARLLGSRWVKLWISLVFLAFTGLSIYGATRLEYGFSLKDITPNASFLRDFYEKHEQYFSNYGDEVVVFFPGTAQLQSRSVQREYLTVVTDIKNVQNITAVSDGLSRFLQNAGNDLPDGDRPQFLNALRTWLQADPLGRNFERDFQFSTEGELQWAKFTCWMRLLDNSAARYNLLQRLKQIVQTAGPHLDGDVYSGLAVIWESDPQVLSFTLTNLAIALAAILGVSLLMIPNLTSAALVVAAVTFVDLCLFGMMGFIHLHLSMISMVNLLISVGYSVDFTIHVAHTFTHCVGSSLQDRISETMVVMGAPVTHGMISTLLAIMALSGSPRYILQVFFKMMLMVVTFSYAAGMIFLPTVLSLVGPTRRHRRRRDTSEEARGSSVSPAVCI